MEFFRSNIVVKYNAVLNALKFNKHLTKIEPNLENLIKSSIEQSLDLIKPQGVYETLLIEKIVDDLVYLEKFEQPIESKSIAQLLAKCIKVELIAVTIGAELTKQAEQLMAQGKTTESMILDAIGSVAVEEVIETINVILQGRARMQGRNLTRRFSAGYGDFSLAQQQDILRVLGAHQIGISLSESFIMVPEKSVTAILGWK